MTDFFSCLTSSLVFFLAGFFSFFVVFDRLILQMRQGLPKTIITYIVMVVLFLCPAVYGFLMGLDATILIPSGILVFYISGEIYRRKLRRRYHGSFPVNTTFINRNTAAFLTTKSITLRRYRVVIPSECIQNPLRIVHMTDFHMDNDLPLAYYEQCIRVANDENPDLIFLTGDFVDRVEFATSLTPLLRNLKAKIGVFAVLGNHDYGAGENEIRSALEDSGLNVLSGFCKQINNGNSACRITICGMESPWGKTYSHQSTDESNNEIIIVLSHNPDYIFKLNPPKPHIMFSGHLHGGQWRFPLLGPLVIPSRHGRLLDHGHYLIQNTNLFVSSGVGTAWFPLRFRCEPEILVVDLVSQAKIPL
jgi:predicted MPP superfamily phosphohydrolase